MSMSRRNGPREWWLTGVSRAAVVMVAVSLATSVAMVSSASDDATEACLVEPLTTEEIQEKVAAGAAMPERVDVAEVRDVGPASPEVVADLERSLAEADACGFDQRRSLRWASDQLFSEIWPSMAADFEEYRADDPRTFESPYIGVTYVREMSDGRIGAVYLYDSPAPSPIEPAFYLFVREGGGIVIDEVPSTDYFESEMSGTTPVSGP